MDPLMDLELGRLLVAFWADVTAVGSLVRMDFVMCLEMLGCFEWLGANFAAN